MLHESIIPTWYHWQELPQVSFLSRQTRVCCNKFFVLTSIYLLQQIFVVTIFLLQQKYFFMTNIKISQQNFCHDKHTFAETKDVFSCNNHMFDACGCSRQ